MVAAGRKRQAQGRRQLLDPGRPRQKRRRRTCGRGGSGRAERQRARLCPLPRGRKEGGGRPHRLRQRAGIRGLARSAGESFRDHGADHCREPRRQTARARGSACASDGEHGNADPHAWQSVANARIYVENIRDALVSIDPAGKAAYDSQASAYIAKLNELDREVHDAMAKVPADRRRVITSHNAFGYFQSAYGISFIAPQGVSTEAEASARDVAAIIGEIRKQKAAAVFLENVTDPRLIQQIARETGAKVGGVLYSDALTDASGDAPTYIDLMRHNLKQLANALTS